MGVSEAAGTGIVVAWGRQETRRLDKMITGKIPDADNFRGANILSNLQRNKFLRVRKACSPYGQVEP